MTTPIIARSTIERVVESCLNCKHIQDVETNPSCRSCIEGHDPDGWEPQDEPNLPEELKR